jgi:hypothetical protein
VIWRPSPPLRQNLHLAAPLASGLCGLFRTIARELRNRRSYCKFYCNFAIADGHYEESDPNGIRTRVTAVKGRCPRPLDDRVGERQISRRRHTLQARNVGGTLVFRHRRLGVAALGPLHAQTWPLVVIFSIKTAVRAVVSRCG